MRRAPALFVAVVLACLAVPGAAFADQSLSVQANGSGAGTIVSDPAGISCGGSSGACVAAFEDGASVALTASRTAGTEAVQWSGCDAVAGDRCEVTMGAARTVTATFVLGWRSQQPSGPNGPTALGEVGAISCWQANRCLLTTPGNGGMPAGIYAYDGSRWYLYSTVCGGHAGRIAWAGPNDFWAIADQQSGQSSTSTNTSATYAISLCHFVNGAVVASYAEPIGVGSSYLHMNAAACNGPNECWFAGERLPGTTNVGAFHLYWNGVTLTAVPSLAQLQPELRDPGREVTGLAFEAGTLYEGVKVGADDQAPTEPGEPFLLHEVLPGTQAAFTPLAPSAPIEYGAGATAAELEGMRLSDAGQGLWAVAGAVSTPAEVTALRLRGGSLTQLPLDDSSGLLQPGSRVKGLAATPGLDAAWISVQGPSEASPAVRAHVARIAADGKVESSPALPLAGETPGPIGPAGPISCAGPEQCWMSTQYGWLFHLGPPPAEGPNSDPAMHTLITFRPADNSLPSVPPVFLPEDNSGANEEKAEKTAEIQTEPLPKRQPALLTKLHQKLIGHTLELSFVLRAKAHVRLVAKRKGAVVGKTKRYTMAAGMRHVRLHLDPKRWPTKLDLQVHAVKGKSK